MEVAENTVKQVRLGRLRHRDQRCLALHYIPRYSFATDLMEGGMDLRKVQMLLGHGSLKTTGIYTHVSDISLQKIVNPLDAFFASKQLSNKPKGSNTT